jgi:hypothetical protein
VKLWKYSIMKMLSGFLDAQKTEGRKGSGFWFLKSWGAWNWKTDVSCAYCLHSIGNCITNPVHSEISMLFSSYWVLMTIGNCHYKSSVFWYFNAIESRFWLHLGNTMALWALTISRNFMAYLPFTNSLNKNLNN